MVTLRLMVQMVEASGGRVIIENRGAKKTACAKKTKENIR